MESRQNKENRKMGGRNIKITSVFKVKKCLFNSQFHSPQSPLKTKSALDNQLLLKKCDSPDMVVSSDESPYSLFTLRKSRLEESSHRIERYSTTPVKMDYSTPLKRSCSFRKVMDHGVRSKISSPDNPVKLAVQKSIQNPDLIGDFSKPCLLPIIEGKHQDLKTISPCTVANLLQEKDCSIYTIIDCRYPYEFGGGHIKNAQNIYCKGSAEQEFFANKENTSRNILIFYCEFSSERAPSMIRFLRGKDRDLNKDRYPHLYYPELYVIEGGYKAFYSSFKQLCEPQEYMPMLDKAYSEEMSFYRNQCKTWKAKNKRRMRTKLNVI